MSEPILIVKDLDKSFGENHAVRGVSFQVSRGEVCGLLGPNGAGKTTAISMLTGLLEPTGGQVTVDGLDLEQHTKTMKAKLGLVPQELAVYPVLSARDNLNFFGRIYGLRGKRLHERVDDQKLMREGLRILLELEPDLRVVGEAEDGHAALVSFADDQPDVVLMDVRMTGMDGVEATWRLRERWPEARVIILTNFDDEEYVFEGLRAGALGYLLKDVSGEELADAVRKVAAGGALIEPSVARKVLAEFARLAPPSRVPEAGLPEPLSPREQDILRLLSQGLNNREIARRLSLAEGTVKNYVTGILQKLGVRDRTQAAVRARELGMI